MLRGRQNEGDIYPSPTIHHISLLSPEYFTLVYPWSSIMVPPVNNIIPVNDLPLLDEHFLIVTHNGEFSRLLLLSASSQLRNRELGLFTRVEEYIKFMKLAREQLGVTDEPESLCISPVITDISVPLPIYSQIRHARRIVKGLERSILVYALKKLFNVDSAMAKDYWQGLCARVRRLGFPTLLSIRSDILIEALSSSYDGFTDAEFKLQQFVKSGFIFLRHVLVSSEMRGFRGVYSHYLINPCAFN